MWRFISSWLGFYSAVAWQLSWYQNSHQDPILTLQEVLELLAFAFECSHWLLCTTPSRQCWVEQVLGSEKVTLENILVYYYTEKSKINHTRCVWNCQGEDGSAFLILSLFFFFLIPTSSPFLKLLKHLVEGCVCVTQRRPLPPPQIRVHSLWINVIFFKLIGLISFWLF